MLGIFAFTSTLLLLSVIFCLRSFTVTIPYSPCSALVRLTHTLVSMLKQHVKIKV